MAVGRKGRKTTFDINELFYYAMTDPLELTYTYIGPTRTQAKEIVWDDHIRKLLKLFKQHDIFPKVNNSDLSIQFENAGKVTIDGSDNIESLRGKSDWGGIVLDEFASWKGKRYAWEEVIEPNLLVHKAWAIISGTPRGYEYFHLLMKMGDHAGQIEGDAFLTDGRLVKPNSNFLSYRFSSFSNPYLDHNWILNKKERLTAAAFNQEYLARFEKFTGLIYKEFDRSIHIIEPFKVPLGWYRYGAMDFGATNPTVHLWIALDRDENIYIYDEYHISSANFGAVMTIESHSNIIKARTGSFPLVSTWGDPSAEQEILDYGNKGIYITPAIKTFGGDEEGWVRSGIDKVSQLLKVSHRTGKPKLFVFRNCVNVIREFESYRWMEKKLAVTDVNEKDLPLKANDHAMDALRYFVCSYFAGRNIGDIIVL